MEETRERTGSWGARIPADLMQGLAASTAPTDADNDGMADGWETAHDLNPSDGSDHSTITPSGYTAIEVYLNELSDTLLSGGERLRDRGEGTSSAILLGRGAAACLG